MSRFTNRQKAIMEKLFMMDGGYVLSFNNGTFKNFIAEITDIDVYTEPGYIEESSKAKKLRRLWEKEDEITVGKVVLGLLDIREGYIENRKLEDDEYIDRYEDKVEEIKNIAKEMVYGLKNYDTAEERLNADITTANIVLKDLVEIGKKVCLNASYNSKSSENSINDYFRDMLSSRGYKEVKDQTRHGISKNGNDAGEVDILLEKDGNEIAIVEGLKLSCIDSNKIEEHINKAIINYNALGTATFIVAYVTTNDFQSFWDRYIEFIRNKEFKVEKKTDINILTSTTATIRIATNIVSRDGFDYPIYYLAINI